MGEFFLFYSYHTVSGGPVLIALVAGEAAQSFECNDPSTLLNHVLSILRGIYGPKGIDVPNSERTICTRWGSDPLSHGSYSHVRVQSSGSDYDILAESVGSRLFFAGEATNRQYPATMHGAFLSGLREASCIFRATRSRQSNPRKCLQRNVGPNNDILVDLFRKPDLAFGKFLFIFDPLTEDPKSMGLMRVTFGKSSCEFSGEDCNKRETENSCQHLLNQPLQLYTVLSREQAHELQLMTGGDESRLSFLFKNLGLKLMGANALGLLGNSLTANIVSARRGRGRYRMFSGQQNAL
uniref:Amine oxidase domain-containing protein n=1 Tax=Davidia involucrata TaxID=16924 RepID=A0A5B7AYD2_DAVIN